MMIAHAPPEPILGWLLRAAAVAPLTPESLESWWMAFRDARREWSEPIDQALIGGMLADRIGYAFAAGYQSALRRMDPALPDDRIASFSVTEEEGGHPRAVRSILSRAADGSYRLSGRKKWATMGSDGGIALVVASIGLDEQGRNSLRTARIELGATGVTVERMPATDFVPEIHHCRLVFEHVRVEPSQLLEGDGYSRYVKPFRTIEDLHVGAALAAHLLQIMSRCSWPRSFREQLLHIIVSLRALAGADPTAAETHLVLEGILAHRDALLERASGCWETVDEEVRARWERDAVLTGVAGRARALRRERAWQTISGSQETGG